MANDHADSAQHARATTDAAPSESLLLDDSAIRRALMRIAHEIVEKNDDISRLYLVGIPNGGVPLAKQLASNLREIAGIDPLVGTLDTTLYRDDLVSSGARPRLRRTEMPSSVDERTVILVDDVASTGRTIRAAMDALLDFGRARAIQVAALVDRGHRELPIKIDYVGKNIPTQRGDRVQMRAHGAALEVVLIRSGNGASAAQPRAQRAEGERSK
jgi:pyrimidine operon attenuation protein/uracil phosphoribosyltransferase